jgi:hypothetical protein
MIIFTTDLNNLIHDVEIRSSASNRKTLPLVLLEILAAATLRIHQLKIKIKILSSECQTSGTYAKRAKQQQK